MKPEEKVKITVSMVNVVTQICAEGVKAENSIIKEEELIASLRRRFKLGRTRAHVE